MLEPHIWTRDFERSVGWYRETLGFEPIAWFPDESEATWCQLRRDQVQLMVAVVPETDALAPNQQYLRGVAARADGPGPALALYLHVEDADAVHERATASGAEPVEDIWDAWWGGRQFTLADPDGNWWTVFQESPEPAT